MQVTVDLGARTHAIIEIRVHDEVPETVIRPELRHIPVIDGDSEAESGGSEDYGQAERLLTEMPQILNPIDPMDGVLPEIDRDWVANRQEEAESLQIDPNEGELEP